MERALRNEADGGNGGEELEEFEADEEFGVEEVRAVEEEGCEGCCCFVIIYMIWGFSADLGSASVLRIGFGFGKFGCRFGLV